MSELTLAPALLLVAWGTLVALDLVSVPQAMIARPFVAGAVAGWMSGDLDAGLRVGLLFELFALDVLPVGAVRYPDYGPATVVATALAAGAPWEFALGLSAALGLVLAVLGGLTLQVVRRLNAGPFSTAAPPCARESRAIRRLQYGGLLRDAARSLVLSALALGAAGLVIRGVRLDRETAVALTIAAVGAGAASALGGALRGAGAGSRRRWLTVGGAVGTVIGVLVWGLR